MASEKNTVEAVYRNPTIKIPDGYLRGPFRQVVAGDTFLSDDGSSKITCDLTDPWPGRWRIILYPQETGIPPQDYLSWFERIPEDWEPKNVRD